MCMCLCVCMCSCASKDQALLHAAPPRTCRFETSASSSSLLDLSADSSAVSPSMPCLSASSFSLAASSSEERACRSLSRPASSTVDSWAAAEWPSICGFVSCDEGSGNSRCECRVDARGQSWASLRAGEDGEREEEESRRGSWTRGPANCSSPAHAFSAHLGDGQQQLRGLLVHGSPLAL
jgi:hypothetical protein